MSDEEFRASVRDGVVKHSRQALIEDTWNAFSQHLFYLAGGNDDAQTYVRLKERAELSSVGSNCPGTEFSTSAFPPVPLLMSVRDCPVLDWQELLELVRPIHASSWKNRLGAIWPPHRPSTVTGRVFDESQIFQSIIISGKRLFRISWSCASPTAFSTAVPGGYYRLTFPRTNHLSNAIWICLAISSRFPSPPINFTNSPLRYNASVGSDKTSSSAGI